MGKRCKVCGISYSSTSWLTFHKFPSNTRLLKMWCEALSLDSETLPKFSYVCSLHFSPSDITMVAGRAQILLNAVPFSTIVNEVPSEMKNDWLKAIGRHHVYGLMSNYRICSEHFAVEDFRFIGEKKFLKIDSIPSLKIPPKEYVQFDFTKPLSISAENKRKLPVSSSSDSEGLIGSPKKGRKVLRTFHNYCINAAETKTCKENQLPMSFDTEKTPPTSGSPQINGCSLDNVNAGEISSEVMEIKIEPWDITTVEDEKPVTRLKCRTCMESVPNNAASVTTIYFKSKSIKDAISELIPKLVPSLHDQDVICNKCLKILADTLLFIENTLKVNKLLEEQEIDLRNENSSDNPQQLKSHCCSDDECGCDSDQHVMDEDFDDCIKLIDSDLDDWVDESDDDIELFSDSSTSATDSIKQIKCSNESKLVKKLRRINFSTFDNSDVEDNDSVVSVNSVKQSTASKLILGLEKIGVKVLSSLDKPDLNNPLRKKRIVLVGNETVKYCPLCSEEKFLMDDKLVEHFTEKHKLSKCFLLEPKLYYEKGRSVPRKVFNCPYCDEIVGEKQLGTHSERQHGDSKPYKCYKCKKEYRRYQELSSHDCFSQIQPVPKKVKVKEKRKCAVCKEKISLELYRVHFDNHKIFKCERCGKKFTNSTSLTNHEEIHHTKTELCPICGKIFNGVGLQLHMANHADKKPRRKDFLCEFCPKSFSSNKNLRAHTKDVHFQCKMLCELCGEKCRASTLPAHIKLKHSKEAIYKCTICGEGFSRSDYFNRHVASHTHKRAQRGMKTSISGKNTPSKCKICSKELSPANYYQHLNSHVTLKRFKCRFCNISYNNYSNARRHEREHLKNPTYHIRCNICWKTFENNEDLNKHTDTHEKKYSCEECGKSFGRKFALSSHIAEAHTDEADLEKREESLRQCYGIGLRKRRRSRKMTIFDVLGDLIKAENVEVVEEIDMVI